MPKNLSVAVQYRDEEGTSASLGDPPDIILPSQYFGVVQRREYLTPEKKVMLAVLEDVVHDFPRYRLTSGRRGKRLFPAAPETAPPPAGTRQFPFLGVSSALGSD